MQLPASVISLVYWHMETVFGRFLATIWIHIQDATIMNKYSKHMLRYENARDKRFTLRRNILFHL